MNASPTLRTIPPTNRYRRRRFALEYAAVPNGTRAAIAAGYAPASAHVRAHRLLCHPEVVAIIRARRQEAAAELGLHGRATLANALGDAVLSVSDFWTVAPLPPLRPGGPARGALRLKLRAELTPRELRALAAESFDADGELVRIVLADAFSAIGELGRRAGLPGFDVEPDAAADGPDPLD